MLLGRNWNVERAGDGWIGTFYAEDGVTPSMQARGATLEQAHAGLLERWHWIQSFARATS